MSGEEQTGGGASALPYRPCVGVMLVNAQGNVFVGQRIDSPSEAWQMPQGGVDPGESLEVAALRELHEETGVRAELVRIEKRLETPLRYDLPPELVGKLWKGRYRGQEQMWYRMRFLGDDSEINIATRHPEFSQWKWIEPLQLPEVIVPFKRDVYTEVVRALAP